MEVRVLVCGGRDYQDWKKVQEVLGSMKISAIIHGKARGADYMAGYYARENGIEEIACPADWNRYGKAAGKRRNAEMLSKHRPDVVVAFPGGYGTADMVKRAEEACLTVIRVV